MKLVNATFLALSLATLPALPASAKSAEAAADEAAREQRAIVTHWVNATWGRRNQGAAETLNATHQAFARHGYKLVSLEPYVENGDLEGFFVTYQKP